MTDEQKTQLEAIVACRPDFLLHHIEHDTNYDAKLLKKVFELAKERANALLERDALYTMGQMRDYALGFHELRVGELRVDAERYRLVRQGKALTVRVPVKDKQIIYYLADKPEPGFPEAYDAAVDAARGVSR
jgi:hypothetical protein